MPQLVDCLPHGQEVSLMPSNYINQAPLSLLSRAQDHSFANSENSS